MFHERTTRTPHAWTYVLILIRTHMIGPYLVCCFRQGHCAVLCCAVLCCAVLAVLLICRYSTTRYSYVRTTKKRKKKVLKKRKKETPRRHKESKELQEGSPTKRIFWSASTGLRREHTEGALPSRRDVSKSILVVGFYSPQLKKLFLILRSIKLVLA